MKILSVILCFIILNGCAQVRSPTGGYNFTAKNKEMPGLSGNPYDVSLGDYVMIDGTEIKYTTFTINNDIDSTMPGSMGFPFKFGIKKCTLTPVAKIKDMYLYKAPNGSFSASHSMLGNVVNEDDEVGIMVGGDGIPARWYVDNSHWNKMSRGEAHWWRAITQKEREIIGRTEISTMDPDGMMKCIQLVSINWPMLKFRCVGHGSDGSSEEFIVEANGDSDDIIIQNYSFTVKKKSNSVLTVVRRQ